MNEYEKVELKIKGLMDTIKDIGVVKVVETESMIGEEILFVLLKDLSVVKIVANEVIDDEEELIDLFDLSKEQFDKLNER